MSEAVAWGLKRSDLVNHWLGFYLVFEHDRYIGHTIKTSDLRLQDFFKVNFL